ncbi:hypothetical protein [Nocardia shimofusensis]|uniref:hypothetical protein n=1 Tax=Nocardia shimofusensis TaxID=228596 RepID=UPI000832BFFD|nr:hypothetical protein [Nocardia shimofusensis]
MDWSARRRRWSPHTVDAGQALDLADHQPLAVAARATALGVRLLNTVLDTRGLPPHDGPRP